MSRGGGSPTTPTGYDPRYGGIPNLPDYTTDTSTMVGTDVQSQMLKNLPGYQAMVGADTGNIESNLAGRIAPDVISLMQQQAAERGVETGAPGAPITDAAYLRALGLTSLQLQQLGHQQLTEAMARTPIQQTQTTTTRRDLAAEKAIYASAPNPRAAAEQAIRDAQAGMGAGEVSAGRPRPGGYTINPSPISPRSSLQQMGYDSSPVPSYGITRPYGATGAPAEYPGYLWNEAYGGYVKDPNYLASQTGGAMSYGSGASLASAGTGGAGFSYMGGGMTNEQLSALEDLYNMNLQEEDYYGM